MRLAGVRSITVLADVRTYSGPSSRCEIGEIQEIRSILYHVHDGHTVDPTRREITLKKHERAFFGEKPMGEVPAAGRACQPSDRGNVML